MTRQRDKLLVSKRLSNNVRQGLEDIVAEILHIAPALEKAIKRAEKQLDLNQLAQLSQVSIGLTRISVRAQDALNKKYREVLPDEN